MKKVIASISTILTIISAFSSSIVVAQSREDADKYIAVVLKVVEPVQVRRSDKEELVPLIQHDKLYPGDRLMCGESGYASIVFVDDAVELKLFPNTDLTLQGKRTPDHIIKRIFLPLGTLLTKVLKGNVEVVTPTAVASVKGTEWWTVVESADLTRVIVLEGEVQVQHRSTSESVSVQRGKSSTSTSAGDLRVEVTDPATIPQDRSEPDNGTLEIEFEDENGDKKSIQIEFEE